MSKLLTHPSLASQINFAEMESWNVFMKFHPLISLKSKRLQEIFQSITFYFYPQFLKDSQNNSLKITHHNTIFWFFPVRSITSENPLCLHLSFSSKDLTNFQQHNYHLWYKKAILLSFPGGNWWRTTTDIKVKNELRNKPTQPKQQT